MILTQVIRFFCIIGELLVLLKQTLLSLPFAPRKIKYIFDQIFIIGYQTVPVASVMAFFVGMVLALQTGIELSKYGTQEIIGSIVGLSMVRELGPVMTSFLVAGRAGSAMAAEIGVMRVYEEIDALQTLDINPVEYLVMPRFLASLLCLPILTIYADCIGIAGGALISNLHPSIFISYSTYIDSLRLVLTFGEIAAGLIKSFVFGAIIALICCYCGLSTSGGARGIGMSTTRSVVFSFMLILVADYFLTRILM
jgi:phospholipid/cholesterol/gamma-HCH transport system permease protein